MKPPFAYYGGKTRLAGQVVSLLPAHQHYVEPFAGSLAVLLAKPRSLVETVNDIDGNLMAFWRVLRDRPDDLVRVCDLTPHGRAEHQACYDLDVADELERARRVWVLLSQGRAGTMRRTGWRFRADPTGAGNSLPDDLDAYVGRMLPAAARLKGVSLESRPALELIELYGKHRDVLLYLDPPYLEDVGRAAGYAHEMLGGEHHQQMLEAIVTCKAAVVLSGYGSELYEQALGDWDRHEISTSTAQGGAGAARTEVIWSNRPFGDGRLEGIA